MAKSKISIKRRTKLNTRKARIQRHENRGELVAVPYLAPKGKLLLGISKLTKKARQEIRDKYTKNRWVLAS